MSDAEGVGLKPLESCPHCGQLEALKPVLVSQSALPGIVTYAVRCPACACVGSPNADPDVAVSKWNTRPTDREVVIEECARVADDERQAAIRAAELGGGASSPTYGHLVYAEAVAERIAAAIRSLNENKG
jgi:hypothetical protein